MINDAKPGQDSSDDLKLLAGVWTLVCVAVLATAVFL
jgi:hypothetical protein